ncbi:MAG: hypothetical protein LUC91_02695 [Prevotella sp.]|nr:hypothetical protein [Prevotella sp.]
MWKEFYNIEETTGINAISTDMQDKTVSSYYTIDGKQINAPTKGINIVRYSDGTTKKIMVK